MLLTLWLAVPASADQCAWVSKANADAALEHLAPGAEWLSFCEPCGDTKPALKRVGRATAAPAGGRFFEVSIDGQPVDLAYTFVHTTGDTGFTNLAKLVDCPATGVSRRIAWPPTTERADRLRSWFGTYRSALTQVTIAQYFDDPNGLSVRIDHPTEHPSGAATVELSSYVDIDGDPIAFSTPFGGCRVRLLKAEGGIELRPETACDGLLDGIAGVHRRVGP